MLTASRSHRTLVGENLHAVDEPDDTVGFVADQAREGAIVLVRVGFEQLRRAADAGERVLDLMREHRGKSGDRARRAAMRQLAVDLFGDRARKQHQRHVSGLFGYRRGIDIDDPLGTEARRADIDAVFGDRRPAVANLVDQAEDRAAERQEMAEVVAGQAPKSSSGRRSRQPGWRRRGGRPARSSRPGCGSAFSTALATPANGDCTAMFMPRPLRRGRRRRRPGAV